MGISKQLSCDCNNLYDRTHEGTLRLHTSHSWLLQYLLYLVELEWLLCIRYTSLLVLCETVIYWLPLADKHILHQEVDTKPYWFNQITLSSKHISCKVFNEAYKHDPIIYLPGIKSVLVLYLTTCKGTSLHVCIPQ